MTMKTIRNLGVVVRVAAVALCITVLPAAGLAGPNPRVYLNAAEIAAIKAKVSAGQEPWKSAYAKMKSDADAALNQAALSVTKSGSTSHDYYTMKPYNWANNMPSPCGATHCDGRINPKADRADYEASMKVSAAVRALGLGYAFTGDARYADKAIALLRVWALDAATYMSPKVFNSQAIEQFVSFPGLFYGADLIWNYPGWNAAEKTAFAAWTKAFTTDAAGRTYPANWDSWRQAFVASGAALIGDAALMNSAWAAFKADVAKKIDPTGRMPQETGRTLSLDYSIYAINAMTQVAEIARHNGVDLYGYSSGSRNLERAWDFHTPYLINPGGWPYEQIKAYNKDGVAIWELAYMRTKNPEYLKVINKYGRPMFEKRTMGPTTLTHSLATSGGGDVSQTAPSAPSNLRIVAP